MSDFGHLQSTVEEDENQLDGMSISNDDDHENRQMVEVNAYVEADEVENNPVEQAEEVPLADSLQASEKIKLKFNEDSFYPLYDSLVQHEIYRDVNAHAQRRAAQKVVCINFTREHFEEGAAKWADLKQEALDLLTSVFNALAFSTAKKEKIRSLFDSPPEAEPPSKKVQKKPATKPQKKKKQKKKKKKKKSTNSDEAEEAEEIDEEKEEEEEDEEDDKTKTNPLNRFIQGNENLSVYVETLLEEVEFHVGQRDDEETLLTPNRVAGYRLWIFDSSRPSPADAFVDKPGQQKTDLLSAGLHESIQEARETRFLIDRELQTRLVGERRLGRPSNAASSAQNVAYKAAPEFHSVYYDNYTTHFNALVKQYFLNDPNLYISRDGEPDYNTRAFQWQVLKKGLFRDDRDFIGADLLRMRVDQLDLSRPDHVCNAANLFTKEAAMIYHVQTARVTREQMMLSNYFSDAACREVWLGQRDDCYDEKTLADASLQLLDSFNASLRDACPDGRLFLGFPFPNTTYVLDNPFLSREFISKMPLPHRIGTHLYTKRDLNLLDKHLEDYKKELLNSDVDLLQLPASSSNDDDEPDNFYHNRALMPGDEAFYAEQPHRTIYGLAETEYEVTPNTLRHYRQHADVSSFTKYLQKRVGTFIPRPLISKFLDSVRNEVLSRLTLLKLSCSSNKNAVTTRIVPLQQQQQRIMANGDVDADNPNVLSDEAENFDGLSSTATNRGLNILFTLPYSSPTMALPVPNQEKGPQLQRKLLAYKYALYAHVNGEEAEEKLSANDIDAKKMRARLLMEADVDNYRETIEKYRPYGNTMEVLRHELRSKLTTEACFLAKDVALRLCELNRVAYANLDRQFFNSDGIVPRHLMPAYLQAKRELQEALAVECYDCFINDDNVSEPCRVVRRYLMRYERPPELTKTKFVRRRMGKQLPTLAMTKEVRPFAEFRLYMQAFLVAQGGLTHNHGIGWNAICASKQHCRWFFNCNNPKFNFGLEGNGMSGKSHMLHLVRDSMPPGLASNVTYITPKAFSTSTNMNDMFIIYEEMEMRYLGVGGADDDTVNFFKARLTNGETTVISWFRDPETGKTSAVQTRNHCQGSMMFASNFNFSNASPNVMSRVVLTSVPKTKHDFHGIRTQDKQRPQYAMDDPTTREMFEQQQELHACLFLVEMMVKSNVFGDYLSGVNMDGAKIMANAVLDRLNDKYGVNTNDPRKRNHCYEMIRTRALMHAVFIGRTSSLTAYLHNDPFTLEYSGFSPRVILDGILPFMCATKDHVIDGLASTAFQFVREHDDKILEAFVKRSRVLENLSETAFLKRYTSGFDPASSMDATGGGGNLGRSGGFTRMNARVNQQSYETDYNFIAIRGNSYGEIEDVLSKTLEEFVVSQSEVALVLKDLAKVYADLGGYQLRAAEPESVNATQEAQYDADDYLIERPPVVVRGGGGTTKRRIYNLSYAEKDNRQVVEYTRCAATGKYAIAVSLHFLKQKLPHLLTDELVEDDEKPLDEAINALRLNEGESMEAQEEEEETREEKIRKIGYLRPGGEKLIYRAIEDIFQNSVLENMVPEELRREYMNEELGTVPWESFITPEHPRTRRMEELSPELAQRSLHERNKKSPDLIFVDKLMMLKLERKDDVPPLVIDNYNTVAPSVKSSLSIYSPETHRYNCYEQDPTFDERTMHAPRLNKRTRRYNETMATVLDKDIDYITCKEHLTNIAFQGLETCPEYKLINYPPTFYMATRKFEEDLYGERSLQEYPYCDLVDRIDQTETRLRNKLDNNVADYQAHSSFMSCNYEEEQMEMREENLLLGVGRKRPAPENLLLKAYKSKRAKR